jgi:hypothetical protein
MSSLLPDTTAGKILFVIGLICVFMALRAVFTRKGK